MATSIQHKRGDTLLFAAVLRESRTGPVIDITDWTLASMVRDADSALIAELDVTVTDAAQGEYTVSADDTSDWPVGLAYWDIQYTDDAGVIRSTDTIALNIIQDITYPEPTP